MFENLENTLTSLQEQSNDNAKLLREILGRLNGNIQPDEQPIDSRELRKRLQISQPTEIAMRKKGKLPHLTVNGHYRYKWSDVVKALQY